MTGVMKKERWRNGGRGKEEWRSEEGHGEEHNKPRRKGITRGRRVCDGKKRRQAF